jgi:hypothetical protein
VLPGDLRSCVNKALRAHLHKGKNLTKLVVFKDQKKYLAFGKTYHDISKSIWIVARVL